jgi:hypothetical protein
MMGHRAVTSHRAGIAVAALALLVAAAGVRSAVLAQAPSTDPTDVRVRAGGSYAVMHYTTTGSVLQRFRGFGQISDLALYDDATVLIAEEDVGRITALSLSGAIAWTVPVHRPRCVEALGPDRLLVCEDVPPRIVEVDRAGTVLWKSTTPLVDAAGAVRLPDGNTAVVEGRDSRHVLEVINPGGEIVWTGTEQLRQPRGLARLPSGELVTSGFDTGTLVLFQPYTSVARTLPFCCHPEAPSATPAGGVLATSAEQQTVQAWNADGTEAWGFKTRYPPYDAQMLADGTVLVSEFLVPDRQCLNAAHATARRSRPLAPYWVWLALGLGSAALATLVLQWPALRALAARPVPTTSPPHAPPPAITRARRIEVGLYTVATVALAAVAIVQHQRILWRNPFLVWPYAGLLIAAGVMLTLLQYRLPSMPNPWADRLAAPDKMPRPTWRMWMLWVAGVGLLGWGFEGIIRGRGEWVVAAWSAGVALLAAGALQRGRPRLRIGREGIATIAVLGVLFAARLYRLEDYPANLHLDMAQWSVQAYRLLDGEVPTFLTNGWAEIPLAGYGWSALWTAVAGRSLAACRAASAVGSIIAIGAAGALAARLYGWRVGLIATIVLGTNHGFLHFSRIQAYMDPIPFHVLAILGLLGGMDTGRFAWFALAGLAGGYSALAYHAGRITPPLLALLTAVMLVRHPRLIMRRWPGLLLMAVVGAGVLGPQAIVYASGRAYALGRSEMYPFLVGGHVDPALLWETILRGVPRVAAAFWYLGDSSTQYGGGWPIFLPVLAAPFGMAVVAAVLRPHDLRGSLIVLWTVTVLFIGGVLTIDPPFWPRFVTAFVPASVAVASVFAWVCRGAEVAAGRTGRALALTATAVVVAVAAWQQVDATVAFNRGIRPGQDVPTLGVEWIQSIMGRDVQRWGPDAMVYIVAENPNWHSCEHPTMQFYGYEVDVQDARDITAYLPFQDPRTVVAYVLPEAAAAVASVRAVYPDVEETVVRDNLDHPVFTRLVIRRPHR